MAMVLLVLVQILIVILMLAVAAPLLAGWLTTRRPGLLVALRVVAVFGFGMLALATSMAGMGTSALVLLVMTLLAAVWPRGLSGGRGIRLRTGTSGRRSERVDPSAVTGVWSRLLRDALAARSQFEAATRRLPRGAVQERLADLRGEVDRAVSHAWVRARRGCELERAGAQIHAASRTSRRTGPRLSVRQPPLDARVADAQRARDAAARRLAMAIGEERAQLEVLVARLGEAACSATELSIAALPALPPGDTAAAADVVERLAVLRAALSEAAAIGEAA